MLNMMPERAKSSLAKVMTALTVVAGAQGVAAVAMPEPEVNVDEHESFDGYALFVPGVANAYWTTIQTYTILGSSYNPANSSFDPIFGYTDIQTEIPGPTEEEIRAAEQAEMKAEMEAVTKVVCNTQRVFFFLSRIANNDIHKRMGDLRDNTAEEGVWLRSYGGDGDMEGGMDYKMLGIQGGYDRTYERNDGKVIAGLSYLHTKADFSGMGADGSGNGNFLGVYGSFIGNKGHYIDAIMKYGRMSNEITATDDNTRKTYSGDTSSNGLNTSLEYGYRQQLKSGYYIEPQVELNYSRMDGDTFYMSNGSRIDMQGSDSLVGRAGFNFGRKVDKGNFYLTCSLLREFIGENTTYMTYKTLHDKATADFKDTWMEYGIGFNFQTAPQQNLYAELTRTALADKLSENWRVNLGYRWSF